jgi:hypothetical protein
MLELIIGLACMKERSAAVCVFWILTMMDGKISIWRVARTRICYCGTIAMVLSLMFMINQVWEKAPHSSRKVRQVPM